jgi:hypothetical protein
MWGHRIVNLRIGHLTLLAAALALSACETAPSTGVAVLPVMAKVSNVSGKTINSITYQPCDAGGDTWSPVPVGTIASGGSATFDIPASCVNLQAFYADGRLAGSQSGVRRDFPLSWVIR